MAAFRFTLGNRSSLFKLRDSARIISRFLPFSYPRLLLLLLPLLVPGLVSSNQAWSLRLHRLRFVSLLFHAHALTPPTNTTTTTTMIAQEKERARFSQSVSQSVRVPGRPSCSVLLPAPELALSHFPRRTLSHMEERAVAQPKSGFESRRNGGSMASALSPSPTVHVHRSSGDIPMPAWASPTQVMKLIDWDHKIPKYKSLFHS